MNPNSTAAKAYAAVLARLHLHTYKSRQKRPKQLIQGRKVVMVRVAATGPEPTAVLAAAVFTYLRAYRWASATKVSVE